MLVLGKDESKKRTPWLFLSNWVDGGTFIDMWMSDGSGGNEKVLWGRNTKFH